MGRAKLVLPILIALAVGLVAGRAWRGRPEAPLVVPVQQPSIGLRQASIILRHKGAKQAEVRADSVTVSKDLRYAVFRRIAKVTLYDQGRAALSLRTGEIALDRTTNDLIARGEVEISSPQGDRLWAPEARWDNATQHLVFPQGVRMIVGDAEVIASRLRVDTRLQVFELEGGVDITFTMPNKTP